MEIIPAILTADKRKLEEWLGLISESGKFERVQIDFVDGEYANNKSVNVEEMESIGILKYRLMYDAHLMVIEKNVGKYLTMTKNVGFDRIIVQFESVSSLQDFTGLALDMHSPVEAIEPYLRNLEVVVVMGVEPGFGGQKFNEEVIKKIKRLSSLKEVNSFEYRICVDGGVDQEQLPELEAAGADEVAVGVGRVLKWV